MWGGFYLYNVGCYMEQKKMDAMRAARTYGKSYTNKLDKWCNSDKTSRKLAIDAFCTGCMGCTPTSNDPGYQEQIRNCTAPDCPLYNFRPYK